jgi:hypothetical protein
MKNITLLSVGVLSAVLSASVPARAQGLDPSTSLPATASVNAPGTTALLILNSGEGIEGSGGSWGVIGVSTGGGTPSISGAPSSTGVVGGSVSGAGVYGTATSSYGVWGSVTTGTGVYGESVSGTNAGGNGVYGTTNSKSTSIAAVVGYNSNGTGTGNGLAGWFQGNVLITGNLTVNGSCSGCSDLRLKKNVKPLDGAIDQLLQLKGVTFEWKDPTEHGHERETGTQQGFIAQDVEKVFPQWVDEKGYVAKDGQSFRTLDLRRVEALEVESIRTLKAENDALKERVSALENARRPVAGGLLGSAGMGFAGLAIAGALMISRRKRSEERS